MSYAGKFLKAHGQDCTINRNPAVTSKVSIKRSTRSSRDLGVREGYWEGLILASALLKSGEIVTIGADDYLTQSVNLDPESGEHAFFAAKCNAVLQHKRYIEDFDENNNIIKTWKTINGDVSAYGEIVTYRLRQEDPGLLDSTKYVFQVPKALGFVLLDRIIYGEGSNNKYQIDSIDDVALHGVVRLQLKADTRPD